jgi:hypothetical protein
MVNGELIARESQSLANDLFKGPEQGTVIDDQSFCIDSEAFRQPTHTCPMSKGVR